MKEKQVREIVREELTREARKLEEQYQPSDFIDELMSGIRDGHMGFTVDRADTNTVRFFTTSNGNRIHVHAVPFFDGSEDITVSVSINDETVRQGKISFPGESMVNELLRGDTMKAAAAYKDAINPVLEAGYGLAEIQ